jgi:redox-sensitive bicupin YhaK (pirin superfamily)
LTEPLYLDVELAPGALLTESVPAHHNAFVYVTGGNLEAEGMDGKPLQLGRDDLAVLSHGNEVSLHAGSAGARFLLVAGRPLNEPVARGGPFVMNTETEIRQAFDDYDSGRF